MIPIGYIIETKTDLSHELTSESVLPRRNKLGIPIRVMLFLGAASSMLITACSGSELIFPTNTQTATQIAKQGGNEVRALLREYAAFIKSEDIIVTSSPVRINPYLNVLERYSKESSVNRKEGKDPLFKLTNTYDKDGVPLTASLTTDRSKLSPVINATIDKVIATEGDNSPKLPMLNEELLRDAFIFPLENDTDKEFSCHSYVVGLGTEYKYTPKSGLSTVCRVWMDKRTKKEIEDWKFELPENLEFTATVDPTGRVFFSVVDMRTLSCGIS